MNTTIPKVVETWMASSENADMLGWDMIVALPIELVNDHVLQALLRKFAGVKRLAAWKARSRYPTLLAASS